MFPSEMPSVGEMHRGLCFSVSADSSQISHHRCHTRQPRRYHRRIGFRPAHADLRTKMEVADREDERLREGEDFVAVEPVIAVLAQRFEQHEGLVQW